MLIIFIPTVGFQRVLDVVQGQPQGDSNQLKTRGDLNRENFNDHFSMYYILTLVTSKDVLIILIPTVGFNRVLDVVQGQAKGVLNQLKTRGDLNRVNFLTTLLVVLHSDFLFHWWLSCSSRATQGGLKSFVNKGRSQQGKF